jgi:chromosome partitioning protein
MTTYVIGHTKGGTGKTTLSVQAALTMTERGHNVWFVDGDRQQTGVKTMTVREEFSHLPPIPASGYPRDADMRSQVRAQKGRFEHVVIDCGGSDSTTLRAALLNADVLVTPLTVGIFELWALEDLEKVVHEVNASRATPLLCCSVLNCADPKDTADNRTCREYAQASDLFRHVLTTGIVKRKAIGHASARGKSVAEYTPRNPQALEEISNFVNELLGINLQ